VSCGDSCDRRALVVSSPRFIDDMVAFLYYMGEGTLQQCVINSFGYGNRLLFSSQCRFSVMVWWDNCPGSFSLLFMLRIFKVNITSHSLTYRDYPLHLPWGDEDGSTSVALFSLGKKTRWSTQSQMVSNEKEVG
jgi:hypothetical protein